MNWNKLLGENLYNRVKHFCEENKLTILGVVRLALNEFIKEK